MKKIFAIFISVICLVGVVCGQQTIKLNNNTHGTTVRTCNATFTDNNSTGNYAPNYDRWITFCPTANTGYRLSLTFNEFDIHSSDSVIIYYGPDTNSELCQNNGTGATYFNGSYWAGQTLVPPPTDTSGCMTFRHKSDANFVAAGWDITIACEPVCQDFYLDYDPQFKRIAPDGTETMSTIKWHMDSLWTEINASDTSRYGYDSVLIDDFGSHKKHYYILDSVYFRSIDLCASDSIVIKASPRFVYNDLNHHQRADSCFFAWDWSDGVDTIYYDSVIGLKFDLVRGYDLYCSIFDLLSPEECWSKDTSLMRIRVAKNPIKNISRFNDMCTQTAQTIAVGYEAGSNVTLDSIQFSQEAREEFSEPQFIPDVTGGIACYDAPVTFTSFSGGQRIKNSMEVQSICMKMEHSFIGDLGFFVECPNGQVVTLKHNIHTNSDNLGIPGAGTACGTCWTYCFSNQYLTSPLGIIGDPTPTTPQSTYLSGTIDSTVVDDSPTHGSHYFQTPIQSVANPSGSGLSLANTPDLNGFEALVGCPLNGEWRLRVCDNWGGDDGWVCSWWMNLGVKGANWDYQVGIDTTIWIGPFIDESQSTPTACVIIPPTDSCGHFTYDLNLIDEFGCKWTGNTTMDVVCTPVVNLGPDRAVCENTPIRLDAGNPGAFRYDWIPTSETTQTIDANPGVNHAGTYEYIAQVTNFNGSLYCYGLDTVILTYYPSATASFTSDIYPLEGCEPLRFQLLSTSSQAHNYYWQVGDLRSNEPSPHFELPFGTYDVSLKVESEHGCADSISYPTFVSVFKSPAADFGWSPSIPSSTSPAVQFVNLSVPDDEVNRYRWEIQTNRENSTDIENVFGKTPYYVWNKREGQAIAGDYNVTLDAYSYNVAPSGYIYECHDTISKVITIINDNIIFPTVVTPNGDGVNDIFEIVNLLSGQAFPDNELSIYNRYGKRVFFSQDIRNKEGFWDPEATNSPTGTYFYKFVGNGPIRSVEFTGSVEIMRD